jgi:chromosomal replication initiation ATPase DnaA
VARPYVPMAPLWRMAQQRLRAELTPAQYGSWLVNTDLYRAPDGSLVLVTHTTFAAELIARRWGERIQWVLGDIMSQVVPLTVKMQRPGSAVPDG